MAEPSPGKLFKQLGKPTIFSDLAKLGLKAKSVGATAQSFSIDPYRPGNVSAFHKLAGKPAPPEGKALLVIAKSQAGQKKVLQTSAFGTFARKNALAALNSERFSAILKRHGYEARVQLPGHRIVIEKK